MDNHKSSMKKEPVMPNLKELQAFFSNLFQQAKKGYIAIKGFQDTGEGKGKVCFTDFIELNDPMLLRRVLQRAIQAANMEKVVLCTPICTFHSQKNAKESNIANGLTLSVDIDNSNPIIALEKLKELLGPPTIIVTSGGIWTEDTTGKQFPRLHLHWVLTKPTSSEVDHKRLKDLRRAFITFANGDSSGIPINHPLRCAGSVHTKETPVLCKAIEINYQQTISLEEAEKAVKKIIKTNNSSIKNENEKQKKDRTSNSTFTKDPKIIFENEKQKLSQSKVGERNTTLNSVAFRLGILVGKGSLIKEEVENELTTIAIGLDLTRFEAENTIKSGLEAGMQSSWKPNESSSQGQEKKNGTEWCSKLKTGKEIKALNIQIEWLIQDIIPKQAVILFFGRGGIGKTTLAMMLCNSISKGTTFLGVPSEKKVVIYVDYENSTAVLSERLRNIGCDEVNFLTCDQIPPRLDEHPSAFFEILEKYPNAVFVIDTLRSSQSGDENKSADMTPIMNLAQQIRNKGGTVIILHHCPKGSENQYKGSTAIFDLSDHVIGLFPAPNQNDAEQKKYFFGTKDKTRYKPFELHLMFDPDTCLFTLTDAPVAEMMDQIKGIIPPQGIIQGQLIEKIKNQIKDNEEKVIGDKKIRSILKYGVDTHWSAEQDTSKQNAIIYKPLGSFSSP